MKTKLLPWVILLSAALVYPLAVVAGGSPRFPSQAECVHAAKGDAKLEAVFGRYPSVTAATTALAHVLELGFTGSLVEPDGCGRVKVVVRGIPSLAVGRDLIAEARGAGLEPTLEAAP